MDEHQPSPAAVPLATRHQNYTNKVTQQAGRQPQDLCIYCRMGVCSQSPAIKCSLCEKWMHVGCSRSTMTKEERGKIMSRGVEVVCNVCVKYHKSAPNNSKNDAFECFKNRGLHFVHINIRALFRKMPEIKILLFKTNAAVFSISESWLDESVTDEQIGIEGYSLERLDRNKYGGGVCVYIRNDLTYNLRSDLIDNHLEGLWLEILLPKTKPILVGAFFRSPYDGQFLEHFDRILSKISPDCETIIQGDFNICYGQEGNGSYERYKQTLDKNGYKQLINSSTVGSKVSATILDHVICSSQDKISQASVIPIGLNDHFITYCCRKKIREKIGQHKVIKMRSMRNYSKEIFQNKLQNIDWSQVTHCMEVNMAWEKFGTIFIGVLDDVVPLQDTRIKARTEPWMTTEILESVRYKNELFYKVKQHRHDEELRREFCRVKNKVQRDIKRAKEEYSMNSKSEEQENNPKTLWQQLEALGYSHKPKDHSNIVLNIHNEICHDASEVRKYLNSYNTTDAPILVSKLHIASQNDSQDTDTSKSCHLKKGTTPNSLELHTVSEDFVLEELNKLDLYKSTGLDDNPARFFRDGASGLKTPLTHLINLSISKNTVPDDHEFAGVTSIFNYSGADGGSYKSDSVLCIVSNILQRAVCAQVDKYMAQ
ncbi:uncharacterized protein LOC121875911 isoform X2 [Homarus americanus]|nr:uncharacterized protein LOC121875911 isoform X2 [Homarus americanus]